jgi:telomerase Cajal body protein 1
MFKKYTANVNVFADPVTSAILHSSGTVVATCSGERSFPPLREDESDSDSESDTSSYSSTAPSPTPDNRIKVWSL